MTDTTGANSADSWSSDADDVAEGYLASWFVREGSTVDASKTLCEIQVERVSTDVAAPATGTVMGVVMVEGDDFARGDVLAQVQPSA